MVLQMMNMNHSIQQKMNLTIDILVLCLNGPRCFAGLFSFAIFLFATITVPFMKGREYKVPNLTLLFLFIFLDI